MADHPPVPDGRALSSTGREPMSDPARPQAIGMAAGLHARCPLVREVATAGGDSARQTWRWPHFSPAELSCRCQGRFCDGQYWHWPTFLDGLEAVRAGVGRPLVITSGHRCAQWNALVGGAPLSQHLTLAADISLANQTPGALLHAARSAGFTGLGLARNFLHIDMRPRPALWFYGPRARTFWSSSLNWTGENYE